MGAHAFAMADQPTVHAWATGLGTRGAIAVPIPKARRGAGRPAELRPQPLLPAQARQPSPEPSPEPSETEIPPAQAVTGLNNGNRADVGTSDGEWVRNGVRTYLAAWEKELWAVGWLGPCKGNSLRAHCGWRSRPTCPQCWLRARTLRASARCCSSWRWLTP
jgi:hypothetical protein